MKNTLLFWILFAFSATLGAQPLTITGDLLLCPGGEGTAQITGDVTYDSYQWFYRYDFDGPFQPIPGATQNTFTYDAYDYVGSEIRVQATLDGSILQSNILLIDGLVFLPIFVISDFNEFVTIGDMGELLLCNGGVVTMQLGMPYTASIQWFKDGMAIQGANSISYEITTPGEYWVEAAPGDCPESMSISLPMTVGIQPGCDLSVPEFDTNTLKIYPNPANGRVTIASLPGADALRIYDVTGKNIYESKLASDEITIDTQSWAKGVYLVQVQSAAATSVKKLIVQ